MAKIIWCCKSRHFSSGLEKSWTSFIKKCLIETNPSQRRGRADHSDPRLVAVDNMAAGCRMGFWGFLRGTTLSAPSVFGSTY